VASRAASNRHAEAHREELAERRRARYAANPEEERAAVAQARLREPEKVLARKLVSRAVERGALLRGDCEVGDDCHGRVEAHHDDYSRPLDVRWLCSKHHGIEHRKEPHATATA